MIKLKNHLLEKIRQVILLALQVENTPLYQYSLEELQLPFHRTTYVRFSYTALRYIRHNSQDSSRED